MGVVVGDCAIYQYHTVSYHEGICGYFCVNTDNEQIINPRALLPHTTISRICRTRRLPHLHFAPGGSALQQPGEILVHDERDARAGKHANDVRAEATVEPRETLMRPACAIVDGMVRWCVRASTESLCLVVSWNK